MTSRIPDSIKRGRMTPDEIEQIADLAERKLTPGQIALRLNRHPATVNYAMQQFGRRRSPHTINVRLIMPASAVEVA